MATKYMTTTNVPKRIAFVVPRYGPSIGGGAETLVRELAQRLAARGDEVQVFSTCAVDNRTWVDALPEGVSTEQGVLVERFPVDPRRLDVWVPFQIRLSEGLSLSLDEQFEWLKEGVNSTALYRALARRAKDFDAIFFAPYLFSTTFFGSLIVESTCPGKAVLIPCLHDEAYAYVDAIGSMFRQVGAGLFNASAERALAERLYGPMQGGEVGMGFQPLSDGYIDSLTPYFSDQRPYLLYVGRKETGKNVQLLIDFFEHFKSRKQVASDMRLKELRLVIAGGGSFSDILRPHALERGDVIDLPHVSETEKHRLLKHASFLAQLSTNESFSIVLMESWALGTPVVVHSGCPVTREHCVESGGGLYVADADEFSNVCDRLLTDAHVRKTLGACGARYVSQKYSWEAVLKRFDCSLESILGSRARPASNPSKEREVSCQQ